MDKKYKENYLAKLTSLSSDLRKRATEWSRVFDAVSESDAKIEASRLVARIMAIDFGDWSSTGNDSIRLGIDCGTMVSVDDNSARALSAIAIANMLDAYIEIVISRLSSIVELYDNNQIQVTDALLIALAMHMSRQGYNIKKCEILDGTAPYGLVWGDIVLVFQNVSEGVFKTIPIELCPMQLRASDKYNLATFISHAMTLAQTDGREVI